MGGVTWGDDPPRHVLHYDVAMTGDPVAVGEALGDRIAADLERLDPGGELPVTIRTEVGPAAAAGPRTITLTLTRGQYDALCIAAMEDPASGDLAAARDALERAWGPP
jgi:hypothetical protein